MCDKFEYTEEECIPGLVYVINLESLSLNSVQEFQIFEMLIPLLDLRYDLQNKEQKQGMSVCIKPSYPKH